MNDTQYIICDICPRRCHISECETGFCGARGLDINPSTGEKNLISLNYGKIASISLDPIEKKPLRRFHPGKMILSVGSFGCNLTCPWCQNYRISRAKKDDLVTQDVSPEKLSELAMEQVYAGNIGVAFTYNEPLISYEYICDVSRLLKTLGLKSVLVTNGFASPETFSSILPMVDAMNIDLKSIKENFYQKIGGDVNVVKKNIKAAAAVCHIELTCLLINEENDNEEEMQEMTDFIASISEDTPLHISRFFPQYEMKDKEPTRIESMERFKRIAEKKLKYVYLGNI